MADSLTKNVAKIVLPEKFREIRTDYLTTRKLVRTHYRYTGRVTSKFMLTLSTLRRFFLPARTISFYPELPRPKAVIFDLCACLGYKIVWGPHIREDCRVLFNRATYIDKNLRHDKVNRPDTTLNGNCRNVSKKHVQECFKEAFGYPLERDPMTHDGVLLVKSNLNYTHDGRIIETPVQRSRVDDQCVYQKMISNEDESGYFIDFRVPVFGDVIPLVYKKYRPPKTRFKDVSHFTVMSPEVVFSENEMACIIRFSNLLQLDFGELDVLRDNDNGRIYIVDANNTPFHASLSEDTRKEALPTLAPCFSRLITGHHGRQPPTATRGLSDPVYLACARTTRSRQRASLRAGE